MPYQRSLTIVAPVREGAEDDVESLLGTMGNGVANGSVIDFGALEDVHFARLIMAPADSDHSGGRLPASVILLSDFDVTVDAHLEQLVEAAGPGIDQVFGRCEGYPEGAPTARDRLDYLRRHVVQEAARYVNTSGRTVRQIRQESALRDAIEAALDDPGRSWHGRDPSDVRRAMRESVAQDPELAWALEPAERPSLAARAREKGHLVAVPILTLPFVPILLLVAPFFALLLRIHEKRDAAPHAKPDEERVHMLAALEDHLVQNPFTAIGHIKPGRFRRWTLVVILFYLGYATRHFFNRGNLAGVKTIHFARWVFIDGRRRMFFASNYDGSLESYMDDFIDKVAWGLNLVFSNGVGYPRTSWLVRGGARDELAFKDYLRVHQVPTRVWFSAYGRLTALNIQQNERIRDGLRGGDDSKWVQSL
ncbi:MAG: hypothetical protein ABWY51_07255 [Gaiellaceae bacterium]